MGRRTNTAVWMERYKRWQIKVQRDNERKTFYSSIPGRNGQRECNEKADAWLDGSIISPNIKVTALFDSYVEELKTRTSKSHWSQYESFGLNWIKKRIGKKKISSVTEQDFQDIVNAGYKKGLSHKTLRDILVCSNAFIKYCRKCKTTNLILENIIIPASAPKKEKIILQPSDITALFENDNTIWHGKPIYEIIVNAWRFEVVTGLRPGEVVGLQWSDMENDILTIKRSINKHNETTSGKNEGALRTFALTEIAKDILTAQKLKLFELGLRSDYVFPYKDGNCINTRTYYNHWVRYRDHHGLSKSDLYGLRHTFVSMVKALPEGVVKGLVGHSSNMDTFGVYGHEVDGELQENANLVQERFRKILGQ